MNYYIVIPAYNEQANICLALDSILKQTLLPKKIVVVNDNSTDSTPKIIKAFANKFPIIEFVNVQSKPIHLPGSKVIEAFNKGLETLDENYDFIVKLDADLIVPSHYFERIAQIFSENPQVGMAGGRAYLLKNGSWKLEKLTENDHIRGAFKAYRKECFLQIGKLKPEMGWDTVDELLARYYGWEIFVDTSLKVKHLKQTGAVYNKAARYKQGEAFYRLGYGLPLTVLASLKLTLKKRKPLLFIDYIQGYCKAQKSKKELLINPEQAKFIRAYRWRNIKKKFLK